MQISIIIFDVLMQLLAWIFLMRMGRVRCLLMVVLFIIKELNLQFLLLR